MLAVGRKWKIVNMLNQIKILYLGIISILLYYFIAFFNSGSGYNGQSIKEWLAVILGLLIPLILSTTLTKRLVLSLIVLYATLFLSDLSPWRPRYSDLEGFIKFFHIAFIIIEIVISHFIIKKLLSSNYQKIIVSVLGLIFAIMLLSVAFIP